MFVLSMACVNMAAHCALCTVHCAALATWDGELGRLLLQAHRDSCSNQQGPSQMLIHMAWLRVLEILLGVKGASAAEQQHAALRQRMGA